MGKTRINTRAGAVYSDPRSIAPLYLSPRKYLLEPPPWSKVRNFLHVTKRV